MRAAFAISAVFLLSASCGQVAFASTTVTLTAEDPQGYFWDAGGSAAGQTALQVYQAFVPNEPAQAFTWTPAASVANGFTVCSLKVCLSDNRTGPVIMSSKADVFTITSQGAALDVTTGRYIEQPSKPANGSVLSMGSAPVAWKWAVASASSTGGGGGSTGEIRIMPLGDSITEGYATWPTFVQGGYRCPLDSLLQKGGVSHNLVGNSAALEPGVVTACSEVNWEGHGGYDIAAIEGVEASDSSVRVLQPQFVLVLAGTNDVAQGETGNVTGQLTNLLNNIFAQDPSAWVIVSTIPPMNSKASAALATVGAWASQVASANAQIKAVAARFPRTTLVDFYSAAASNVGANIGTDGIHPSVTGYGVLASLWYNAIKAHLASE